MVPRDAKVFLSRVFTVPRTEHGKEYGRRFILKSKSEFCSILPRISVGPHLYAPLGSYTFCTKISISEYLSID